MPLFQDEEQSKVYTDFGDGSDLTIFLKDEARGSGALDSILERYEEIGLIQARIEGLKKIVQDPNTSPERMKEAHVELKTLRPQAQPVGDMVKMIHSVGLSWDYYASKKAKEEGGQALPFTEANIKRIHPTRLAKIIENISHFMRMDDDEGNSQSATSLEPSRREESAPSNIRDGIFDNRTEKPSQDISIAAT